MFDADAVEVGSKATPIVDLGPTGVIIQVLDGGPVTLGGQGIKFGKGLRLAVEDGWQPLPGGYSAPIALNEDAVALTLYGVTDSGKAKIAYLRHNLPPS